jgi:molybdenum-dependent DNA-binding transcriptional regulator ModE
MKPVSARSLGYAPADKRIQLLRLVGGAAPSRRAAGVSYGRLAGHPQFLTNLAGEPLSMPAWRAGGGGARPTPAGERLLEAAARWPRQARAGGCARQRRRRTAHQHVQPLALRNWGCQRSRTSVMVRTGLPDGTAFCSAITRESAELVSSKPACGVVQGHGGSVRPRWRSHPGGARSTRPGGAGVRGAQREVLVTVAPGASWWVCRQAQLPARRQPCRAGGGGVGGGAGAGE